MKHTPSRRNDLVLLGGGHSHVQVLESFAMERPENTRITLVVDRPVAIYSGMVPGFVAGQYRQEELEIDVVPLARRIGARVVLARATGIDPVGNRVHLEGRPPLRFDFASINVGSTVAGLSTPGVREHAIPTRPIGRFVARLDALFERLGADAATEVQRAVVVGGGVGGVEVAFALDHRIRRLGARADITLVEAGPQILPAYSSGMRRRALRVAAERGIRIVTGRSIERADAERACLDDGGDLAFDLLLWVTGAAGGGLFRESNLPTDDRGFALTRSTLQLEGHDHVFAVGDCATLVEYPRTPKAGVYAVRQGPVLASNLRRVLAGGSLLERYKPQHDFLTLINTGDGSAIGGKWSLSFEGAWVFRLKDHIDRKFMHRFQPLEDTGRTTAFDSAAMAGGTAGDDSMDESCGGCAAKLGRHGLERALSRLEDTPPSEAVELGLGDGDDAACYTSPLGQRVVASVDQFRAFTDDPYLVGRVGAINAASDLYAKGIEPRFAQALVALPEDARESERQEILYQLMAGAAEAFRDLEVELVGGHTTTAGELLAGFHVEGFAEADAKLLAHAALTENQTLVLTKALGTGVLFRADMMGRARGEWLEHALGSMLQANREASRVARRHGATAATDVTGFGLAGHLDGMLRTAGLEAVIEVAALPALPGSVELLGTGLRSTFHEENAKTLDDMAVQPEAAQHPKFELLFDPQTSGGLLFAAPADRAEAACQELRASGHAAVIVGITRAPGSGRRIRVR